MSPSLQNQLLIHFVSEKLVSSPTLMEVIYFGLHFMDVLSGIIVNNFGETVLL